MNKIYTEENQKRKTKRTDIIKKKINSHQTLSQREIIEYINLTTYDLHFDDGELKNIIETWVMSFSQYHDPNELTFIASFPSHYMQRIFELAITNLVAKKFTLLNKNQEEHDLTFFFQDQKYYLECATRTPSQMDKFYDYLPHFDLYCQAAKLLIAKFNELTEKYKLSDADKWYFETSIEFTWAEMGDEEKLKIIGVFEKEPNISSAKEILTKFQDWVYFNEYACLFFKNFIPSDLWPKYKDIDFSKMFSGRNNYLDDSKFAIDSIIEKILDKLTKKYFADNVPVVLAISIANFPEIAPIPSMPIFLEYLIDNLPRKLTEAISNHKDSNQLQKNSKNLYAILIDSCWYNWFPNIAKNRYRGSFPHDIDNHYAVIYNTNCSSSPTSDNKIFESLVNYRVSLPLCAEELEILHDN